MDFAFWDVIPHAATGAGIADEFDAHIRLAQHIEALGWHSYFVIEHQNTPQGTSSPSVYLTAVARATSTLRLGAMMWQLPFYHPLRLAQDVAMLDQLSRGRVEFGTGIGVHEHEFIRWGVDYYQRAAISEEVLAVAKMAWTQDEVTFGGKYFHFDEALPHPKPFQQPHPPIWAAVHSDTSVEFAARNNYHVAATDEQAQQEAREYLAAGGERVGGGPIAQTRIGWGSHSRGMGTDGQRTDNLARGQTMSEAARNYEFNVEHGLTLIGSPETIVRRLQAGQQRMGYDVFCTNHQIGRMPAELVSRSIEVFGKEVIPAFAGSPAAVLS